MGCLAGHRRAPPLRVRAHVFLHFPLTRPGGSLLHGSGLFNQHFLEYQRDLTQPHS